MHRRSILSKGYSMFEIFPTRRQKKNWADFWAKLRKAWAPQVYHSVNYSKTVNGKPVEVSDEDIKHMTNVWADFDKVFDEMNKDIERMMDVPPEYLRKEKKNDKKNST